MRGVGDMRQGLGLPRQAHGPKAGGAGWLSLELPADNRADGSRLFALHPDNQLIRIIIVIIDLNGVIGSHPSVAEEHSVVHPLIVFMAARKTGV